MCLSAIPGCSAFVGAVGGVILLMPPFAGQFLGLLVPVDDVINHIAEQARM